MRISLELFLVAGWALFCGLMSILLILREVERVNEPEEAELLFFRRINQKQWKVLCYVVILIGNLLISARMYWIEVGPLPRLIVLLSMMWGFGLIDLISCTIPNRMVLLGILMRIVMGGYEALIEPEQCEVLLLSGLLAGAALAVAGLLCRLVAAGALGFGDIKLLFLMGLFLGMEYSWNCIFWSLVVIFCISLVLLLTRKADKKTAIPFAPALLLGTIIGICT